MKHVLQSDIGFKAKLNACFHLMVGLVFISVFIAAVCSVPLLFLKTLVPQLHTWFQYASFSAVSLLFLGIFHYVSTVHTRFRHSGTRHYFFKTFPLYLSFSMSMSLSNAIAVMEGWLGIKTVFV